MIAVLPASWKREQRFRQKSALPLKRWIYTSQKNEVNHIFRDLTSFFLMYTFTSPLPIKNLHTVCDQSFTKAAKATMNIAEAHYISSAISPSYKTTAPAAKCNDRKDLTKDNMNPSSAFLKSVS